MLVNDILVGLERILDYAGVGLERFICIMMTMYLSMLSPYFPSSVGLRLGLYRQSAKAMPTAGDRGLSI